jgi:phospholipid transport system substrate-binding protein
MRRLSRWDGRNGWHRCASALLVVLFLAGPDVASVRAAEPEPEPSPTQVIETLNTALLALMKVGPELDPHGRFDRIAPTITATHDLDFIARFALGRYWDGLTEEQRGRYLAAFRDLSIATYASRFNAFEGERFRVVSEEMLSNGDARVRSVLSTGDGDEVAFEYRLRRRDGPWRIINIEVDGVSDLALKRSEYTGVMHREGIAGLLARMEGKRRPH